MESLTLFKLMDAKLAYAAQRQNVLSMNIANADTPRYQAKDLKPLNFKAILAGADTGKPIGGLNMTRGNHIAAEGLGAGASDIEGVSSYEVAPAGNAVDIEEQMLKASKNNTDATIVTQLYAKQLSLLRLATGNNGR